MKEVKEDEEMEDEEVKDSIKEYYHLSLLFIIH
jgi:hypothetical protein